MNPPKAREKGVIPPRHGGASEGSRIFGKSLQGRELIDFSINVNPLGPPPGLMPLLSRVLEDILSYPEIDSRTLTDELSTYHRLSPDHFIVGNGSTDLLFSLISLFPRRRAIIPYPSFIEYERVCSLYGWHILHIPPLDTNLFGLDMEAILSNLVPDSTLFLCQPNNPTGIGLAPEMIERILDEAERKRASVILDEAFLPFTDRPSAVPLVSRYNTLIVLRSMTKSYGIPGLRLGYAVGAPEIVRRWRRYLPPWNVNVLAQASGAYCLRHGDPHLLKSKRFIQHERDWLMARIGKLPSLRPLPSEANFFLVSIESETFTADDLYLSLGKRGILVRHCGSFRGMGRQHIRIGIKSREDHLTLLSSLHNIVSELSASSAAPRWGTTGTP